MFLGQSASVAPALIIEWTKNGSMQSTLKVRAWSPASDTVAGFVENENSKGPFPLRLPLS
jgi:hypothetical protein